LWSIAVQDPALLCARHFQENALVGESVIFFLSPRNGETALTKAQAMALKPELSHTSAFGTASLIAGAING
jgi:hypothetical protein